MSKKMKYSLMVAIGAAATGILSSIIKLGMSAGVSFGNLMLFSVGLSFIFFMIIMIFYRQGKLALMQSITLFSIGMIMGLSAFTYTKTVESLPASIAVVLQFQFIWMGVMLDALYRRQWPSGFRWLMVALILIGTVLAAGLLSDLDQLYLTPAGVMFGLLCAICFSVYLFFNAHAAPGAHWSQRTFYIMAGCLASTLLLILPGYQPELSAEELNQAILYGGLIALFGYGIPIAFFAIGIPNIGSGISSILCACELPMAVVGAMLILDESVSGLQWLGVIIIFASMFIRDPDPLSKTISNNHL